MVVVIYNNMDELTTFFKRKRGDYYSLSRIRANRSVRNCGLHPLIHTFAFLNSAQDIEKKKAEPKTPHILS